MTPLDQALAILSAGQHLTTQEAYDAVGVIMSGQASEGGIAAFLTALRFKGEASAELAGTVRAVRDHMAPWEGPSSALLDTCGTGGDCAGTFNVSTGTALCVAACGMPVAKHGNRSATGRTGSAEVLEALGIKHDLEPPDAARCLAELGITFLFAPRFHPAMRFAAPVRRMLPFRTIFNLVGPLANPARPSLQLVGVPSFRHAELVADVLLALGAHRAAVVTGCDGLDEVTLAAPTHVRWVEDGTVRLDEWTPHSFGLPPVNAADIRSESPAESAERLRAVFAGEAGPARDVILANTAAALLVAGRVATLREGVGVASKAIDMGAVASLVEKWRQWS
jgi:anthranilate phosphoribosyltransferase